MSFGGLFTEGGKWVSDQIHLLFNNPDKDAMSREKKQVFLFTSEAKNFMKSKIHPINEANQIIAVEQPPVLFELNANNGLKKQK